MKILAKLASIVICVCAKIVRNGHTLRYSLNLRPIQAVVARPVMKAEQDKRDLLSDCRNLKSFFLRGNVMDWNVVVIIYYKGNENA